jgi:hypothetical protein
MSKSVEEVQESEVALAVAGLAASDSRRSTFVRRDDGSSGSLMQFELRGSGEKTMRVVIWDGGDLPEVKSGDKVMVTNLRHKKGRQGESELHGDSATVIQMLGDHGDRGKSLGVATAPRLVKVVEVVENAASGNVTLEVMALSKGSVREVSLKDGLMAKKGEVVLGDDTGEITAVAWDEASKTIGEIQVGEKIRVHDAIVQVSKVGVRTLELGNSSKVERLREKG